MALPHRRKLVFLGLHTTFCWARVPLDFAAMPAGASISVLCKGGRQVLDSCAQVPRTRLVLHNRLVHAVARRGAAVRLAGEYSSACVLCYSSSAHRVSLSAHSLEYCANRIESATRYTLGLPQYQRQCGRSTRCRLGLCGCIGTRCDRSIRCGLVWHSSMACCAWQTTRDGSNIQTCNTWLTTNNLAAACGTGVSLTL
jgi:hypothetical protein